MKREDPLAATDQSTTSNLLHTAIEHLSREHREVIELTFFQGLNYKEIATIVECPEGTVKTTDVSRQEAAWTIADFDGCNGSNDIMNKEEAKTLLPWFAAGALEADEARAVEAHLQASPELQQELAELKVLQRAVGEVADSEPVFRPALINDALRQIDEYEATAPGTCRAESVRRPGLITQAIELAAGNPRRRLGRRPIRCAPRNSRPVCTDPRSRRRSDDTDGARNGQRSGLFDGCRPFSGQCGRYNRYRDRRGIPADGDRAADARIADRHRR